MIDQASLASAFKAREVRGHPQKRYEPLGETKASSETGDAETTSAREIKENVTAFTLFSCVWF